MINARDTALHILYDIEYNGAYSNIALKNEFGKKRDLETLDKAFITRIVYGVEKMKLTLDYIIECNSKIKIKKISKYILIILRMGIYQLKYMDKVPESAAVNESVKLAKRYGHGASAGFVNGMLRNIARTDVKLPKEELLNMAYKYSYPVDLCKKWCSDFGKDFTEELLAAMNEDSKITLRINTLKTTTDELLKSNSGFVKSELYENAVLCDGFDVGNSDIYKKGLVIAQDISAMMASQVLSPKVGSRVLDMCAAPGGKTTHMAELMKNKGEIVACDIHPHKVDIISENADRMGIDIINACCIDSCKDISAFHDSFDYVLADVPCSGYGIIKRKPDIKWKSDNIDDLLNISLIILTNAAKYVKIGGEIVFSTCTINKEENEERLSEFLRENPHFETVDISDKLPSGLYHDTAKQGHVTLYPNVDNTDGFFIAKVKRCR